MPDTSQGQPEGGILRNSHPVPQELGDYGIVNGFVIGEGTGLNPAITKGRIITPNGIKDILDADVGSFTDSQTTYLYYNVRAAIGTSCIEHKTSNAPTNPEDILLGIVVTAGADITEIRLGQWANSKTVQLVYQLDITGTANYGPWEYFGKPTYYLGTTIIPIITTVGTDASILVRRVPAAGTAATLTTTAVSAQTAAVDDIVGAPTFRTIAATPVAIRPGDRLYVDVATAIGTSGSISVNGHLGGIVLE